ncbi:DNA-directed RNA polymerase subunit delta [Oceanobacillus halotolerans]|uniref:DNA-directed RNA polymerase subunit delta n=1 Tax=Oceanobacillus halotolerans TaxID=2663380 RepID=UPI0013DC20C9|nr:DNA-directed RNA polymerase subunit delta [Oceanobacillus halotolerans]
MSLETNSHEDLQQKAMIDLAYEILQDERKAMDFREVFEKVAEIKGFTNEQKDANIAQFYTDLNINGHFLTKGSNLWGLKEWYSVEDIDEEITAVPKKKKKKKKKKKEVEPETFDYKEDELDDDKDSLEVLTADFKDDKVDDEDDVDQFNDLDDDLDDGFDDDEFDDEFDEEDNGEDTDDDTDDDKEDK